MIVDEINYICPKCRRTFQNYDLRSFSSHMAQAARDFMESNEFIDTCPDCKARLVQEEYIKFYDKKGEFNVPTKDVVVAFDNKELFRKFVDFICEISPMVSCLDAKTVTLEGVLKLEPKSKEELAKENKGIRNDNNLRSSILLSVSNKDKTYTLYNITLGLVEFANIGGRYNSFYVEYFAGQNTLALNFFKELLEVDLRGGVKVKTSQNIYFDDKLQSYRKTCT